ncbi:MAG: sensor domain-containing diguanylate cyclase [Kangiellaceae bacterium]|jgi:diguanylate cyclase (GGDEF)-like protein/PAS domain S-box-containing protein
MNDFADNNDEPRQIKEFDAEFYQAMIDTLVDGAFVVEKKCFKLVNQAFCKLTGFSSKELIGKPFDHFIFPQNIPVALDEAVEESSVTRLQPSLINERLNPDTPSYHLVLANSSGSNTPIELNSQHFIDQKGNFYQIANVRQKQLEERLNRALRESERELQLLVDNFPSIYLQANSEGKITRTSSYTAQLLGYQVADLIGIAMTDLYVEGEQYAQILASVIQEKGDSVESEAQFKCKDGGQINTAISSYAKYDRNRELVAIEVIASRTPVKSVASDKLSVDVIRDPLTKLINQLAFAEHLAKSIRSARRHQSHLWVLYIGLQNLPAIVSKFGEQVSSACLVHFSQRLQSFFRDTDIVARVGEDNFAVLLDDYTNELALDDLITRLQQVMDKRTTISQYPYGFTFSVGMANFPQDGINSNDLMTHAESLMYQSKFSQTNQK